MFESGKHVACKWFKVTGDISTINMTFIWTIRFFGPTIGVMVDSKWQK